MKKVLFGLIIILGLLILVLPVSAWGPPWTGPKVVVVESCPEQVCVGQPFSCTFQFSYDYLDDDNAKVDRFYDPSMVNVISTATYHYPFEETWFYQSAYTGETDTGTITMTPTVAGQAYNRIIGSWYDYDAGKWVAITDTTSYIPVNHCTLGSLHIRSRHPGAGIILDGKRLIDVVTPHFITDLAPGIHTVQIIPPGSTTPSQIYSIDLKDGQITNLNTDFSTQTPEFPSMLLPITMIIGFIGAVLLIQRTREH